MIRSASNHFTERAPWLQAIRPLIRAGIILGLAGAFNLVAAPLERHFIFAGTGSATTNALWVTPDTFYSHSRGYGVEPGANVSGVHRQTGATSVDFCTSDRPFYFSVDLPEGNYRATLTLGDPAGESRPVIKAESRRLVLPPIDLKPGETTQATVLINIRNARLPDGGTVRLKPREIGALHWDDRLTLEFNGLHPCVTSLDLTRVEDAPTVFLIGDSTVTDQQIEPWAAWGQMLPSFFGPTVAIANHAESGETIKSFVGERRWEKVLSLLRGGDYVLMQFGHNDQKLNAEHTDAATSFKDYLRRFITETRTKGAFPVLVTSMERRNFDANGKIVPSLEGYPQAMREVGKELGVPVIDLNAMSIRFYEALGPEAAKKAFVYFPANTFPGQTTALADDTHFSAYGAYELARGVVTGIHAYLPALARHLRPDLPIFDPVHPDRFADWHLPPSPPRPVVKPEGS